MVFSIEKIRVHILILLLLLSLPSIAQEDSIDYAAELAKLELELDSIGIFSLFDSVLALDFKPPSEMNARFGYNSSVINAGRDFGIDQHGLTPGLSFYHRSGFFADATGFWNSEADPKYNLTMVSAGYLGNFSPKWSYSAGYERWIYNKNTTDSISVSYSFENSLSASASYDVTKWLTTGVDYSYLFGEETAHRIIGSVSGRFNI